MQKSRIAVLGAGAWGATIGNHIAKCGNDVLVWAFSQSELEILNTGKHPNLEKLVFDNKLKFSNDIKEVVNFSEEIVVLAVPSFAIRQTLTQVKEDIKHKVIVNLTKGIEKETLLSPSRIIKEVCGSEQLFATLSGPTLAGEVAEGMPTACVIASNDDMLTKKLQQVFASSHFRVYASEDIMGIELAGALKNVIALCSGIVNGVGYGDNARAGLMTRGLVEIIRIGVALGAQKETFSGLAGIGDVIATATSTNSRNFKCGYLLGQGKSLEEAKAEVKMVVEGVDACVTGKALAEMHSVSAPIINEVYAVLFEGKSPHDSIDELMTRKLKLES